MRKPLIDVFLDINSKVNLSAIRDEQGVRIKHIDDALELTKIIDFSSIQTLCDVGTGGGFPLLALSMYCRMNHYPTICTGLDARRKKIDAISMMIQKLHLSDTEVVRSRVEDHTKQYHVVTARAVAYADTIIPRCKKLCRKDGMICLYKEYKREEKEEIQKQCKRHHLMIQQEHFYTLFEGDIQRVIYVLVPLSS